MSASAEPALHFRIATPADIPLIHPLVESAYRGDESRLGWTTEADILTGQRIDAAGLLEKITHPDGVVLLATSPTVPKEPTTASTRSINNSQTPFPRREPSPPPNNETLLACCELVRHTAPNPGFTTITPHPHPNPTPTNPPPPTTTTTAYFGMFAVAPRRQNSGIGRRMLSHAESYARRAWGATAMEMTVIAGRDELVAWYERRGFRRTGETRPFPMAELAKMEGVVLREGGELWFEVLVKELEGGEGEGRNGVIYGGADTPVGEMGVGAAVDLVAGAASGRI